MNAKKSASTKHIIITRDNDLTDLARAQWLKRISVSSNPEGIRFDDVNVIFRVVDQSLTNLENVGRFKDVAREIMKAAYSGKAASYTISKSGIHIERGSSLSDLIEQVDKSEIQSRANQGQLSHEERTQGRSQRYGGRYNEIQEELVRRQGMVLEAA